VKLSVKGAKKVSDKLIRVLLIEDDPMVQEVNKQFIEKVEGYKVIDKASNGVEGFQKVKELNPDLVVLDIYMPKQDGIDMLYQIRKEKANVDVIVITAANDKHTIRTIRQNGAIDYIIKPFKFERIRQTLENYKQYWFQTASDDSISQKQLDHMLFIQESGEAVKEKSELPKGLNEATLQQIIRYLIQQTEEKSAEEVAEGIGLARVTARRYLEYLYNIDRIELDVKYGGVGRPVNRYFMK
jgi:two-component system response regulator DctR